MTHARAAPLSRRHFIKAASLIVGGAALGGPTLLKAHKTAQRRLYLYNIHTGEWFKDPYWEEGAYLEESLHSLRHFMRDRRSGESIPINPALLDLLQAVATRADSMNPMELICGYRCPATNAALRRQGRGVASKSLHMEGCAADIRVKGVKLSDLRDIAKREKKGGVGYYPSSQFIHVDIRPTPAYW